MTRRTQPRSSRLLTTVVVLSLGVLVGLPAAALGQMSGTPYFGRLASDGSPAHGDFDLEFELFDAPDPDLGAPVAGVVYLPSLMVHQGRFSALLDFGNEGPDVGWLEVRIRESGSSEPFETLRPRQPWGFVPEAKGGSCNVSGDLTVQGDLGVGGTPSRKFTMVGTLGEVRMPVLGDMIEFTTPGDIRINASNGGARFHLRVAGGDRLTIEPSGWVGIGTTSPGAELDLHGSMRFDSGVGLYRAVVGGTGQCATICANQDATAGFESQSGVCLAGWDSGGNSVGCGGTNANRCLCAGAS